MVSEEEEEGPPRTVVPHASALQPALAGERELRARRRRDLRLGLRLALVVVLEQVAAALALLFETRVPPCGTALQAAADGEVNLGTWCLGLHLGLRLGFIVVVVIVVVVLTVRGEQVAAAVAFHRAHT